MNQYKYILWDWNGTLLDDVWLSVDTINVLLNKYKLPAISAQDYKEQFNFPVKEYYEKIGFDFSQFDFPTVGQEYIDQYNTRRFECNLHAGSLQMIERFAQEKIGQFVLSAREQKQLEHELQHFQLKDHFANIVGIQNNLAHGKIETAHKLVESLKINHKSILMIGDTVHDCEVAKATGIDIVLIAHGHHTYNRLSETGQKVINRFEEIFDLGLISSNFKL